MFARRRKRKPADAAHGPGPDDQARGADGPGPDDQERQKLFERWRQSEQRVTSAWNAWQAGDRAESGDHYDALMDALAEEEEAAAEIERRTVGPLV